MSQYLMPQALSQCRHLMKSKVTRWKGHSSRVGTRVGMEAPLRVTEAVREVGYLVLIVAQGEDFPILVAVSGNGPVQSFTLSPLALAYRPNSVVTVGIIALLVAVAVLPTRWLEWHVSVRDLLLVHEAVLGCLCPRHIVIMMMGFSDQRIFKSALWCLEQRYLRWKTHFIETLIVKGPPHLIILEGTLRDAFLSFPMAH